MRLHSWHHPCNLECIDPGFCCSLISKHRDCRHWLHPEVFVFFCCSLFIINLHYKSKWGSRSHYSHLDSPCDMGMLNPMSRNRLLLTLILSEYLLTIIAGDRSSIALQNAIAIAASFNTTEKYIVAL